MGSSGVSTATVASPLTVTGNPANLTLGDGTISKALGGAYNFFGAQLSNIGVAGSIGFFGAARIAQPASVAAPVATAATNVGPFGYATAAQADAIVSNIINIRTALVAYGLLA